MRNADTELQARFEALIERAERLSRRLPFLQLRELARLYRLHAARLAQLRSADRDPEAIGYMNALCVRAYPHIYRPASSEAGRTSFLLRELPATLGRTWRLQALIAGLMVTGALLGAVLAREDPRILSALVPFYGAESLQELLSSSEARKEFLNRDAHAVGYKALFGTQLFLHNTQVSFLAFASGVLAGIPTLLLVLSNGALLGAFASLFTRTDEALLFWAWLLPHGIPELLAIVQCATGGLLLGLAVLAPGRAGRGRALRAAGREAVQLVFCALLLLAVAAFNESFIRETTLSTPTRLAIAALATAAIVSYVVVVALLARRTRTPDLSFLTQAVSSDPDASSHPS